jgi:hypothetical protein
VYLSRLACFAFWIVSAVAEADMWPYAKKRAREWDWAPQMSNDFENIFPLQERTCLN